MTEREIAKRDRRDNLFIAAILIGSLLLGAAAFEAALRFGGLQ